MDTEQQPDVPDNISQDREIILAKFESLPNENNTTELSMDGQQVEEHVLGYLEVPPSQLQAVQEGGTIYFQSDGLDLDEHLILAQGEEGGEIIVVVRTDDDGSGLTGEVNEATLRAMKFGDLSGLSQLALTEAKLQVEGDEKGEEGTTYVTYQTEDGMIGHIQTGSEEGMISHIGGQSMESVIAQIQQGQSGLIIHQEATEHDIIQEGDTIIHETSENQIQAENTEKGDDQPESYDQNMQSAIENDQGINVTYGEPVCDNGSMEVDETLVSGHDDSQGNVEVGEHSAESNEMSDIVHYQSAESYMSEHPGTTLQVEESNGTVTYSLVSVSNEENLNEDSVLEEHSLNQQHDINQTSFPVHEGDPEMQSEVSANVAENVCDLENPDGLENNQNFSNSGVDESRMEPNMEVHYDEPKNDEDQTSNNDDQAQFLANQIIADVRQDELDSHEADTNEVEVAELGASVAMNNPEASEMNSSISKLEDQSSNDDVQFLEEKVYEVSENVAQMEEGSVEEAHIVNDEECYSEAITVQTLDSSEGQEDATMLQSDISGYAILIPESTESNDGSEMNNLPSEIHVILDPNMNESQNGLVEDDHVPLDRVTMSPVQPAEPDITILTPKKKYTKSPILQKTILNKTQRIASETLNLAVSSESVLRSSSGEPTILILSQCSTMTHEPEAKAAESPAKNKGRRRKIPEPESPGIEEFRVKIPTKQYTRTYSRLKKTELAKNSDTEIHPSSSEELKSNSIEEPEKEQIEVPVVEVDVQKEESTTDPQEAVIADLPEPVEMDSDIVASEELNAIASADLSNVEENLPTNVEENLPENVEENLPENEEENLPEDVEDNVEGIALEDQNADCNVAPIQMEKFSQVENTATLADSKMEVSENNSTQPENLETDAVSSIEEHPPVEVNKDADTDKQDDADNNIDIAEEEKDKKDNTVEDVKSIPKDHSVVPPQSLIGIEDSGNIPTNDIEDFEASLDDEKQIKEIISEAVEEVTLKCSANDGSVPMEEDSQNEIVKEIEKLINEDIAHSSAQSQDDSKSEKARAKRVPIKRKLFSEEFAPSKKVRDNKRISLGKSKSAKRPQSQDELFDELIRSSQSSETSKKRKKEGGGVSKQIYSKRRRTIPARFSRNDSSDEDEVVLSNLRPYPVELPHSEPLKKKREKNVQETVASTSFSLSNEKFRKEFNSDPPVVKRGRGRPRTVTNLAETTTTTTPLTSLKPKSTEKGGRGRGRPLKNSSERPVKKTNTPKKRSTGNLGLPIKDCKFYIRHQETGPPSEVPILMCRECLFKTQRLENMIQHYKNCRLGLYPLRNRNESDKNETTYSPMEEDGTPDQSVSMPESPNKAQNRKIDSPKKTSTPSFRKGKRTMDSLDDSHRKLGDRDHNEASDADSDDELPPAFDQEMKNLFGFSEDDVVWAEWRGQHWPALVKKIYPKNKKVTIVFIDTPMPKNSFKFSVRKITNFNNAAKNKLFLGEGCNLENTDNLIKAVQKAEDYLRKRCLGLKISATQFFNNPEDVKVYLSELEESVNDHDKDILGGHQSDLMDGNSMNVEESLGLDSFGDSDHDVNDESTAIRKEACRIQADKLVKMILDGTVTDHLLGIYKGAVQSERHKLFHSPVASERNKLKRASYFGIIHEEPQQTQVIQFCLDFFEKNIKTNESFPNVGYCFEVWAPEAIVKAISLEKGISMQEANEIFSRDDAEENNASFTADSIHNVSHNIASLSEEPITSPVVAVETTEEEAKAESTKSVGKSPSKLVPDMPR